MTRHKVSKRLYIKPRSSSYYFINLVKVRKRAKIRNRYNQAPHLTQDINGRVTTALLDITNEKPVSKPYDMYETVYTGCNAYILRFSGFLSFRGFHIKFI